MTQEYFLIAAMAALPIASVFYIPKHKLRLVLISFLAFQAITWARTIILEQIGIIEYPVREFMNATQGNFTLHFLFTPMIFTWFILLFPNKASIIKKIIHYLVFISAIVWPIFYIAVYTDLQNFLKGSLISHLIRLYISFTIYFITCRLYVTWFSKKIDLQRGDL